MSAVVKAIKSVANVVLDVVEAVGEVVVDVVDTVVETIEYVAKNPEIIVIAVAAPQLLPYIGVTGAAVAPVTAGLISASQGGDLEDIGKAALTAYVAPQVGAKVGRICCYCYCWLFSSKHIGFCCRWRSKRSNRCFNTRW
jgi:hypothetical protein